jgi:hypothetical protein
VKAHFPTVPVYDLTFVKDTHDLVVATHGRGIFVFDDLRPLEQLTPTIEASNFHVFAAGMGTMFHHWSSDEENPVPFSAPNAPNGAAIDYLLKNKLEASPEEKSAHQTPVKITVTDAKGEVIATHYGPSNAGINRFVWDMRYQGSRHLESDISSSPLQPGELEEVRYFSTGPRVLPGTYAVAVTVNGETQKTSVVIKSDPNLDYDATRFRTQTEAALGLRNEVVALNTMIERINSMERQLQEFKNSVALQPDGPQKFAPVLRGSEELEKRLKALKATVYDPNIQHNVEEDDIRGLSALHEEIEGLAGELAQFYDQPPNALLRETMAKFRQDLEQRIAAFNAMLKSEVATYNKTAYSAGAATVFAGEPIVIRPLETLP